jgi:hypothetical protein
MSPNSLESSGKLSTVFSPFPALSVIFGSNFTFDGAPHAKFAALAKDSEPCASILASQSFDSEQTPGQRRRPGRQQACVGGAPGRQQTREAHTQART